MTDAVDKDRCQVEVEAERDWRQEVPAVVEALVQSCRSGECFDHVGPEPIPSREAAVELVQGAGRLIFPGYFHRVRLDELNLPYYLGQEAMEFYGRLAEQLTHAIRHECLRYHLDCTRCGDRGQQEALRFMRELPRLRGVLATDVRAAHSGDPAAKSYDEIIFCYPGVFAIMVYRVAHQLHRQGIPLIPRIMAEYAHGKTGIDIHPGAQIGESFFIDHGTGVVIGETTRIGTRVRLYQGVTLGALSLPPEAVESLRDRKRHPTIEDDVIIYSGATILGGETVIGARSTIGGNVWLTESVPPDTRVFLKKPELVIKGTVR